MSRDPIPTWYFALCVVRYGRRFLVVRENNRDKDWFFPGGRVESGETIVEGAKREAIEESGVPVVIEGIFRIQHTVMAKGTARVRVIFIARPADDTPPKQEADEETLEARWVTLEELDELVLRSAEVRHVFTEVAGGAPIYPLSILSREG